MYKLLLFIFCTGSFAWGSPPPPTQEEEPFTPLVIQNKAPVGWEIQTLLYTLRCPLPESRKEVDTWMVTQLKKGEHLVSCLEMPAGRINDIIIDENRQLAIVSAQLNRAAFVIYIVSLKQGKVWLADPAPLDQSISEHAPKNDPQDRYAYSPFQLIGLRQTNDKIEGLVRHTSGINPKETGLSMLIRFTIDLTAPQPEHGKPWPITITQIEDSMQEREWKPGNRDFNPPLLKPQ